MDHEKASGKEEGDQLPVSPAAHYLRRGNCMEGKIINNQYAIGEKIGEGGMSRVFSAEDLFSRRQVAVKLLKENVASSYVEDIIRFKKEIEIVSKFDHPNIVKVYDCGEYNGTLYLVMEQLSGENLALALHKGKSFPESTVIKIIKQLAEALKYVHHHGVIHRDIKPSNIFLTGENDVKLLDFGLALIMELGKIKDEDRIAGTFGYMSPEATGILEKKVDERSDLYSLGVIFYQLLTGKPPFQENSISKLLHKQVAFLPPRPSQIKPDIPQVFDQIVMKLLAKDPDLRYQSAQGLLYDLERYESGEKDFPAGERDQKVKITYQTKLIGREAEISMLKELLEKACAGKGGLCLISGEAGMGKSRLVEELRSYFYEKDVPFFRGRCLNQTNKIPYYPVRNILDEFIARLEKASPEVFAAEAARIKKVLGKLAGVITQFHPRLENLVGKALKPVPLKPERETQRFLMALSDLFCGLAAPGQACVLFIDDLQWADEGSLFLLQEILRKIDGSHLLILGTYRDNEVGTGHRLTEIIREAKLRNYPVTEIKLSPITLTAANELLASLLGIKPAETGRLAYFLYKKSRGNPFFIINILRELFENNGFDLRENSLKEDWERIQQISIPGSIVDIIIKRIKKLPPEAVDLLSKAAVLGKEFSITLLYRLTDLRQDQVVSMIDEFLYLQLLEKSPDRSRLFFAHDRIRDAFYAQLKPEERKKIHYEIAKAIEEYAFAETNRNRPESVIFDLAYHYVESEKVEEALDYIIAAAEKAKSMYANEEAIKYYQIAINTLAGKDCRKKERLRLQEELIRLLLVVGENDQVITKARDILLMIDDPVRKAGIYNLIGIAYFKKGNWREAEEALATGLGLLGEKIPGEGLKLLYAIGKELALHIFYFLSGLCFRIYARLNKGKTTAKPEERARAIIWLFRTLGWLYMLSNVKKLFYCVVKMINVAEARLPESRELAQSIAGFAGVCMAIPIFKMAVKYNQRALRLGRKIGDEWGEAQSLQFLGFSYAWQGNYEKAIDLFNQAGEKFEKIGDLWEIGMVSEGLGYCYRSLGQCKKSMEIYRKYLDLCYKTNNTYGIFSAYIELAVNQIKIGDYDQAFYLLDKVLKTPGINDSAFNHCYALTMLGLVETEKANYRKAVKSLHAAEKIDRENNFVKNYTSIIYPYLADACIKQAQAQHTGGSHSSPVYASTDKGQGFGWRKRKQYRYLSALCRKALRETRPWAANYGAALRVRANYYALRDKKRRAKIYYEKSIRHAKKYRLRYELAKTYYEYAGFLSSYNEEKARCSYLEAYRLFEEIDNKDYLQRCAGHLGVNDFPPGINDETRNILASSNRNRERLALERRMEAVTTTARHISSLLDLELLLNKIIDSAVELVGAERGILMLYQETGEKKLELQVLRNISPEEVDRGSPVSSSIISKIEAEQRPVIITDAVSDEDFKTQSSIMLYGIRSVLAAPIMRRGQMLGVLYLDNNLVGGLFNEEDLKIIELLLNQAGISIENARLYKNLTMLNQNLEKRVQERTKQLESLNKELLAKNEELEKQAAVVEELAAVKERNRIANEVHDTLGHTMTAIKVLLDLSLVKLAGQDLEEAKKSITNARKFVKEGMAELRRSLLGLSASGVKADSVVNTIKSLIPRFEALGVQIDLDAGGPGIDRKEGRELLTEIYGICREVLTNAIRHGKAENISIILRAVDGVYRISIIDDGCGCKKINKGFGLLGIEERINKLNGRLLFGSDGVKGFYFHMEIPAKGVLIG